MKCFNCGAELNANSMRCPKCGFMPDIEFMRKCPNLQFGKCSISNSPCKFLGRYQLCPTKNEADSECWY